MITRLRPTFTFDQERIDALRAIAPEAFADGKVNWDVLHGALGDHLEDEGRDAEHFGLFWPGKREARRLATVPSAGALRQAPGEGVNEDSTRNIFIEGDNLEVLKLLQRSYIGRVKLVFIDPPYNTGQDFVYHDDFRQPLDEYLRLTGATDEVGRPLATNTEGAGRLHSAWLSMMYPRLRLARNLLRDDGVILISIDDGEVANLKLLMNEVFGEENFVAHIVWQKRYVSNVTAQFLSDMHDHILCFAKQRDRVTVRKLPRTDEQLTDYQNPDNDARGVWRPQDLSASKPYSAGKYPIVTPLGQTVHPPPGRFWRCSEAQYKTWLADGRIWFGKGGRGRPMLKAFLAESQEGVTPNTWWSYDQVGHNKEATLEIKELFGGAAPFDTPKPVRLIRRMLELLIDSDALVMDFFAGSCTTAHAVLAHNRSVGSAAQYIMVQLPEPTPVGSVARTAGYDTVAEIGKDRMRRVIQRMQVEDARKLPTGRNEEDDLGFKVYRLERSIYKAWRDFEAGDVAELQMLFDRFESPLVDDWKTEDVLVEVMLIEGFPLDSIVSELPQFTENRVQRVISDMLAHHLFVCLDAHIHDETIAALTMGEDDIFICLDSALSDEAKVRLEDGRRVKVI